MPGSSGSGGGIGPAPVPTGGGLPGGTPPGAPPAPGRAGGGAPGARRGGTDARDTWEFWWEANDAALLAVERGSAVDQRTSAATLGFGRGVVVESAQRLHAGDRATIRAALLAALADRDAELADSAAIALGRSTPLAEAGEVIGPLLQALKHPQQSAREAATLALGILGHPGARPVLTELLLDRPAGRARVGQPAGVESRLRAFAAAALGMLGEPSSAVELEQVVRDPTLAGDRDLQGAAVRALGMVRGATERTVPLLVELLAERRYAAEVRAQVPIALAQLAQARGGERAREALPALAARLAPDATDRAVTLSCAIAVGRMASLADGAALAALEQAADGRDAQLAHFALVALAEIARRETQPADGREVLRRIHLRLRRELVDARPSTGTPYGAIGLALSLPKGRGVVDGAAVGDAQLMLQRALRDESNPSYRAAIAMALGLVGSREVAPELIANFRAERNPVLRSYLALALGMVGAEEAAAPLRELLLEKGLDPGVRLQVARALGLLGDREAVPLLAASLRGVATFAEAAALAQALGLIRDRAALEPLLALAGDATESGARRAFAVVALGLLAEKSALPWNAAFTTGSNFLHEPPALREIADIL
ncbi:MAG: HEAT repeat domain-containing protein [Planctomycetes bacterium]|nr:HEAT repeat domain-containing protein [Planctomycetota bacterium]